MAIVSGTRTIEPGRALIKVPAVNGIGATETGADTSWLFEYDADDPCDAFVSVLPVLACEQLLIAILAFCCCIKVPAVAGASFNSWPGTTEHNKNQKGFITQRKCIETNAKSKFKSRINSAHAHTYLVV